MKKATVVLILILASCTSVKQKEVINYERNVKNKYPAINLFVNGGHHIDSGCYNATCYSLYDRMPEFVEREFITSGNFEAVTTDGKDNDWSISVDVRKVQSDINGHGDAKFFVNILTLGAIPTTSEHIYAANIEVYAKGDIVKSYRYRANIKEVSSLFVDLQADDSDAVKLLMSKFFKEIEDDNPFQ